MAQFNIIFKYIGVFTACCLLSACLGGTVAQQIARSIATSMADKAMARALDVDEDQAYSNRTAGNRQAGYTKPNKSTQTAAYSPSLPKPYAPATNIAQNEQTAAKQNANNYQLSQRNIIDAQNDPYRIAITNTAFETVNPQDLKPIAEPLPAEIVAEAENTVEVIQSSQLVRVELFNLLIGDEKNAVYEQASLMGATSLPQKREWALWQVATGAIQNSAAQENFSHTNQKPIIFLIPPEFGKLPSGAVTMVELASPGELNVARYKTN